MPIIHLISLLNDLETKQYFKYRVSQVCRVYNLTSW